MPNTNQNQPQEPIWRRWVNAHPLKSLAYLTGIFIVSMIIYLLWHQPDTKKKKQRFLQRETNQCQECDLSNQDFSLKRFNNADFSAANLKNAIFGGSQLKNSNFSGANLQQAVLRQANLENTIFDGANLQAADFHCGAGTCTYLMGTSFRNANLTGADFRYVGWNPAGEIGLVNVDFTGANLSAANFEGASLKGALLNRAKLCKTKMPDGKISDRDCSL